MNFQGDLVSGQPSATREEPTAYTYRKVDKVEALQADYCRCGDNAVILSAKMHVDVKTTKNQVMPFPGGCLSCGRLTPDGMDVLCNRHRLRLVVGTRIGQKRARPPWHYHMPNWGDKMVLEPPKAIQSKKHLMRDWRYLKSNGADPRGAVKAKACADLLIPKKQRRYMPRLAGVPEVYIAAPQVGHIVDALGGDDNHILPLPLLGLTLAAPDEVWQHDAIVGGVSHRDQAIYLKRYESGGTIFTHFAVADPTGFLRSAYQLSRDQTTDPQMNEKRRFGIFLYARYGLY